MWYNNDENRKGDFALHRKGSVAKTIFWRTTVFRNTNKLIPTVWYLTVWFLTLRNLTLPSRYTASSSTFWLILSVYSLRHLLSTLTVHLNNVQPKLMCVSKFMVTDLDWYGWESFFFYKRVCDIPSYLQKYWPNLLLSQLENCCPQIQCFHCLQS